MPRHMKCSDASVTWYGAEAAFDETKERYVRENQELNPKFIFAFPAYNLRNTEIGGILGRAPGSGLMKSSAPD